MTTIPVAAAKPTETVDIQEQFSAPETFTSSEDRIIKLNYSRFNSEANNSDCVAYGNEMGRARMSSSVCVIS